MFYTQIRGTCKFLSQDRWKMYCGIRFGTFVSLFCICDIWIPDVLVCLRMGFLNRMQGDKKDRLCPWLLLPVHKLQGWKFAYFLFCSKDLKTHSVSSFLLSNLTKSPGSVCNSFKFWLLCWKAQLISKTQLDWQSRQGWRQSRWNFWKSCLIFFSGCLSYFVSSNILHSECELFEEQIVLTWFIF